MEPQHRQTFGRWLRDRRKALDLTQDQLAVRAGYAADTIRKVEADRARPSRQLVERLAEVFAVPSDERDQLMHLARSPGVQSATALSALTSAAPLRSARLAQATLTFLFTDVEGSTRLWEADPRAMSAALVRHDAILRERITEHQGSVFKFMGDACCAVFTNTVQAVTAAVTAQRALSLEPWPSPVALRVRMAIHTGVVEIRDNDYYGLPLSRIARLLGAAHGGQMLLSQAAYELVRDSLSDKLELRDLGIHRLKDLTRAEHIFQVVAQDLFGDFPPIRTLTIHPGNLPVQSTPLIGREQIVKDVSQRLRGQAARLVTLTGPGGVGKTRVSIQVAAELLEQFPDGAFFVDLAPITNAALLLPAIAQVVGVKEHAGQPLSVSLKSFLRSKHMLLVLDNFEQLVDSAALLSDLLEAAASLKLIVTSREILHLRGEHEFVVPPLSLPDRTQLPAFEQLSQYEAVRLFIERAQAARANLAITNETVPAVAEICVRLDGLPLAIELAAARSRMFEPSILLAQLDLSFLTGGYRDLPARQQTLRQTIDWSYDLLDAKEQAWLGRLAVFVGGWMLDATQQVCNPHGDIPLTGAEALSSLIDKSLVQQEEQSGGALRFRMLETVREYAQERLQASGLAEEVQDQHVAYFVHLAEQAQEAFRGTQQRAWLHRLELEHNNFRAALQRAFDQQDVETLLRLSGALWRFWTLRGHLREGQHWLETALKLSEHATQTIEGSATLAAAHAKVLHGAGRLADDQGDHGLALARCQQSLAIWRSLGDAQGLAGILDTLGWVVNNLGDLAQAHTYWAEGLDLWRTIDDKRGMAVALDNLGYVAQSRGDYAAARLRREESLKLRRELGHTLGVAWALSALGDVARWQGDNASATSFYQESIVLFLEVGDAHGQAWSLQHLGEVTEAQNDDRQALDYYHQSLTLFRKLGDKKGITWALHHVGVLVHRNGDPQRAGDLLIEGLTLAHQSGNTRLFGRCLVGLAGIALDQGKLQRAVQLLGATADILTNVDIQLSPLDRREYSRVFSASQTQLSAPLFEQAWSAGQASAAEQILESLVALR